MCLLKNIGVTIMENLALESMVGIAIAYCIATTIMIIRMIYLIKYRQDPIDIRWGWPLGFIIIFTIIVIAFEFGLAEHL